MATLSRVTTTEEDAAIKAYVDRRNQQMGTTLTARDMALEPLNAWIDLRVQEYRDAQKVTKGEAYNAMTPSDRAIVDPIFAKYGA